MQFSSALIAAVAFGFANAVSFTNSAFNGITAGQPIELTWTDASGPVTITLKNGDSGNLQTVSTVTSGQTGGTFTWNVPSSLTQDTYALEIIDSTAVPNYSPQFELIGGATATATSSRSSSASASASSSLSSVSSSLSSASSSLSSVVSSISSSLSTETASSTSSSAAPTTTGFSNSTTTTGSSSSTRASSTGSRTSSAGPSSTTAVVPNSNSAADIASPLALVFLTFAAILSFN